MSDLEILIGKTITSIERGERDVGGNVGQEWIKFTTQDEIFHFDVEGDCCSYSWIESIENEDSLIGEEVLRIEEKSRPPEWNEEEDNCRRFYNEEIITRKGTCTIDYRNDSNGYYGGCLELIRAWSVIKDGSQERIIEEKRREREEKERLESERAASIKKWEAECRQITFHTSKENMGALSVNKSFPLVKVAGGEEASKIFYKGMEGSLSLPRIGEPSPSFEWESVNGFSTGTLQIRFPGHEIINICETDVHQLSAWLTETYGCVPLSDRMTAIFKALTTENDELQRRLQKSEMEKRALERQLEERNG